MERARRAYHANRYGEAICLVHRMEQMGPLKAHHCAFLGTAHVLTRDSLKAQKEFQRAEELSRGSSAYDRYVNAYAKIYLEIIDSQKAPDRRALDAADAIDCRPPLKRLLPLKPEQ